MKRTTKYVAFDVHQATTVASVRDDSRMRKKTAPRTRKHQAASSPKQSGLIAREKNATQSAVTKCALDNRFHRTDLPISCCAITCHAERC